MVNDVLPTSVAPNNSFTSVSRRPSSCPTLSRDSTARPCQDLEQHLLFGAFGRRSARTAPVSSFQLLAVHYPGLVGSTSMPITLKARYYCVQVGISSYFITIMRTCNTGLKFDGSRVTGVRYVESGVDQGLTSCRYIRLLLIEPTRSRSLIFLGSIPVPSYISPEELLPIVIPSGILNATSTVTGKLPRCKRKRLELNTTTLDKP